MNKLSLTFDSLFPIALTLGLAIAACTFFIWLELRKKQKFLGFRIVALLIIAISILGLALRPSFPFAQNRQALLLTPGYDRIKVDSVLSRHPDLKIIRTHSAEPFPNALEMATWNLDGEDVRYILGQGLPDYELEYVRSNFIFFPSQIERGVKELIVPEIVSGRKNFISGLFNTEQRTKLNLVGPGGQEDSTFVHCDKKSFALSFTPKQPGLFIYKLISEDSLGIKVSERLPIEVKPEIKLRLLLLQDFPYAEFRQLKNYLAEHGHSVLVRTRISKNDFTEEFINAPKVQLKNLTTDLLNGIDLVLTDSKSIESLKTTEKSTLELAVRNGLGLMVFQDGPSKENTFYSLRGKALSTDTAHISINNKRYVLSALPIEIKISNEIVPLLKNRTRVLAGYRFLGAGKIGFQLLQETFRIKLEGDSSNYATIWSTVLENISRKKIPDFELKMDTYFPYYSDEPINFSIVSTGKTPKVFSDGTEAPLNEDVIIDDYWHGKIWADIGWHQLRMVDSTAFNYFVHNASEWKSLRSTNLVKQTTAAQTHMLLKKEYSNERYGVPPLLFFMAFLLASAFLWLAPKI